MSSRKVGILLATAIFVVGIIGVANAQFGGPFGAFVGGGAGGGGGGATDHGALTGLSDDDHTQYCLADGTRAFTGSVTVNDGANADLVLLESAIRRNSASNQTLTLENTDATAVASLTIEGGLTVSAGNGTSLSLPNNSVTDAMVSNTLTCSAVVGSGSTTDAVDLATAEVAGTLADGNVSDTITASNYLPLAGGTMTGSITASGVTTDFTCANNEDCVLAAAGTGSVALQSGDNNIDLRDSSGNVRGQLVQNASSNYVTLTSSSNGRLIVGTTFMFTGSATDVAATADTWCTVESMTTAGGGTRQFCVYGGGGLVVNQQQAITIADDGAGTSPTDTTTPTSTHVEVTCNDSNGCNYNPGETSMTDGRMLVVINVSASNTVTINDSAGVVEVRGGATLVLAASESATCNYTGSLWTCR